MTLFEKLGVENEAQAEKVIDALFAPPVVLTVIATFAGVSVSGVGNRSFDEIRQILLEAIKIVTIQEVKGK